MSYADQYEVIKWVNDFINVINQAREKLKEVGVKLARRKAGVGHLATRDLQQRMLNKIVEQHIGLRLNEKTQRLYLEECRRIRRDLSGTWYSGKRWTDTHQLTDKASLKKLIKDNVEKGNVEHFKELKTHQDKMNKGLKGKAA